MTSPTEDLFVWGSCEDGQLTSDNTDTFNVLTPKALNVQNLPEFVQISCGYTHTVFLTIDGEVYSCGCNEFQQLGHRQSGGRLGKVAALEQYRIISVACGAYHNAAVTYSGLLFTWGCNSNGQLGREGDDTAVKLVRALSDHRVVQVSLGVEHTLVLTDTARVFAFGSNLKGQLGLGFSSEQPVPIPQQILCLSGLPIRRITAGGWHSFVLTVSGSLYAWGSNKYGQLGLSYFGSSPSDHHEFATKYGSSFSVDDEQSKSRSYSPIDTNRSNVSIPTYVKTLRGCEVVYLACGEAHTVALTRDGGVFTFGAGRYGQLGHNELTIGIAVPRKIIEFTGNVVTQIACGRFHTLALIPKSGRLFAFGQGTNGQLGMGDTTNRLLPCPVKGQWVSCHEFSNRQSVVGNDLQFVKPYIIRRIFSGGDHAYLLAKMYQTGEKVEADDLRNWNRLSLQSIVTICPEIVQQLRNALTALPLPPAVSRSISLSSSRPLTTTSFNPTSNEPMSIVTQVESAFSSLGCLSASCLEEKEPNCHFKTGREEHGVDLDLAYKLQSSILHVLPQRDLKRLINKLMDNVLTTSHHNYPSIECLRGLMFLAVSDLMNMPLKPVTDDTITEIKKTDVHLEIIDAVNFYPVLSAGFSTPSLVLNAYSVAVNRLDSAPSKILDRWFTKMQPRYLKKLVLNLNNLISYILDMQPASSYSQRKLKEEGIRQALEFMKRLHRVNESHPNPIPYNRFYLPSLKDKINIGSAFVNWLQECNSGGIRFFSFFDYPFVFDAASKAELLNVEARLSMQQAMTQAQQSAILQTFISPFIGGPVYSGSTSAPYFTIVVRRNNILQDTLSHLTMANPADFKKLLKVQFENEEAVDEGGVMKEFFLLVMRDLLNPVYGMFRCYPESHMLWFNESTMESENVFLMAGILCGLAIYNSIIVDLSFPQAMFCKLLGGIPGLDDFKELDPIVGRSLQQLLDYDGDDLADVFYLNFSVTIDYFGVNKVIPLMENGENIVVTQENKNLYVEKYVDYVFNKSCETSYKAFEKGFLQVCNGYSLKLFHPFELQALVVGSEVINWDELRQNTTYQGVYWDRHQVIIWFWEVLLHDFTVEEKKKFLRFLTGCDRVPVVGFSGVKITIQPNNSGDDFLPVAHTCANLLDLPQYSSKEILSKKLSLAIQQTEGFGLV
ncbi:putative E3 ubiquitin-protein ligase HERC4 [Schistosoma japonicum]|nr:putative E3 ubiquitin-protein ligase HERC4 [Schistosoma japonicum]